MLHGGDVYGVSKQFNLDPEELVDFSANINPLGTPENVVKAMIEAINDTKHYPDPLCQELTRKIGKVEGVDEKHILCGNGAADLIYRMVYALQPKRALLVAPTFLEYEEALKQVSTKIEYYPVDNEFRVNEDILEAINKENQLVFICNPNNPTGILTESKLLMKILEKSKEVGAYLMIDECFLDFVEEKEVYSFVSYINENDKLMILKSFTKMYGIPGVRLGYLISKNTALLQKMRATGQTWAVNTIAQKAGIAALGEKEFVKDTIQYVKQEREYLKGELERLGLIVLPGSANYLFFYGDNTEEMYERLLKDAIIIRKCKNYPGLTKKHYRIAVRKHEDNQLLMEALKRVINEHKTENNLLRNDRVEE